MFGIARQVGWVKGAAWGALTFVGSLALACGGSSAPDSGAAIAISTTQAEAALTAEVRPASAAVADLELAPRPAPTDPVVGTAAPVVEPGDAQGWLIEMPEIQVRAATAVFGLSPAGVMEVPADHRTVAWYDFSSVPGRDGNAVLAAHVNWRGEQGVFSRLGEVTPGSEIAITAPSGERFTYRVQSVELVDLATADVAAIIGSREGAPTLTLITCGGTFNTTTRDYEQRVIVRAALADRGTHS